MKKTFYKFLLFSVVMVFIIIINTGCPSSKKTTHTPNDSTAGSPPALHDSTAGSPPKKN
jgi:hypothetical protein